MSTQPYSTFTVSSVGQNIALIKIHEKRIYLKMSDQFREEMQRFLGTPAQRVIVDLSQVSVMNSVGLGVLIALQNELDKRSGQLCLVGLQPLMEEIFTRMRLEYLFKIAPTVEAALPEF